MSLSGTVASARGRTLPTFGTDGAEMLSTTEIDFWSNLQNKYRHLEANASKAFMSANAASIGELSQKFEDLSEAIIEVGRAEVSRKVEAFALQAKALWTAGAAAASGDPEEGEAEEPRQGSESEAPEDAHGARAAAAAEIEEKEKGVQQSLADIIGRSYFGGACVLSMCGASAASKHEGYQKMVSESFTKLQTQNYASAWVIRQTHAYDDSMLCTVWSCVQEMQDGSDRGLLNNLAL